MTKIRIPGTIYPDTGYRPNPCTFADCMAATIRIECENYCLIQLGRNNTQAELQVIMHLDADLSSKISHTLYRSQFKTYNDLQMTLTDDEMETFKEKFITLTQFQRQYLFASPQEKISILGLDDNNTGQFGSGFGNLDTPTGFEVGVGG